MKLFAYLPNALIDNPKNALLVCFGCGITAKALTENKDLASIDFVDTSKDIIELSKVVYPDPQSNPIYDSRVHTYIEDGRFYLKTTAKQYDIITAENGPAVASSGRVNDRMHAVGFPSKSKRPEKCFS